MNESLSALCQQSPRVHQRNAHYEVDRRRELLAGDVIPKTVHDDNLISYGELAESGQWYTAGWLDRWFRVDSVAHLNYLQGQAAKFRERIAAAQAELAAMEAQIASSKSDGSASACPVCSIPHMIACVRLDCPASSSATAAAENTGGPRR